uniref:Uncharacterized protein n=1 Tax=Rhizophora mucronata TaxID=61149 RepID=A0A2P2NB07_RHIMU
MHIHMPRKQSTKVQRSQKKKQGKLLEGHLGDYSKTRTLPRR